MVLTFTKETGLFYEYSGSITKDTAGHPAGRTIVEGNWAEQPTLIGLGRYLVGSDRVDSAAQLGSVVRHGAA